MEVTVGNWGTSPYSRLLFKMRAPSLDVGENIPVFLSGSGTHLYYKRESLPCLKELWLSSQSHVRTIEVHTVYLTGLWVAL